MKEMSDTTSGCARALDLVAYLYGEASAAQARDFEGHMRSCRSCAAELEGFAQVRAQVGAWRLQSLASLTAPETELASARADAPASSARRKPSALAAVREFFALSPAWLRGATAFASLALCALAVFAAVNLWRGPRVVVLEKVVEKGPTQADVDAIVKTRVREELAARTQREAPAQSLAAAPARTQKEAVITASMTSSPTSLSRRAVMPGKRALARASTQESEQIARDLQLIPTREEEDLPRLIDLMEEAN